MQVKRLPRASLRAGFPIVAVEGLLRVADAPHKRCTGYSRCCICDECMARKAKAHGTMQHAEPCGCEHPLATDGRCFRCGKDVPRAA